MSDEEKERRKKAFEALTRQQRADLELEYKELCQWNEERRHELEEKLQREGKRIESGLDTDQHYYEDIIREYRERFHALQVKYGII